MVKNIFITLLSLIILIAVGLMILGYLSRSGGPKGLSEGKLTACPDKPNCVCSEYKSDADHYIAPLIIPDTTVDIQSILNKTILEAGGIIHSESNEYIAAAFSSSVFGFVDDLEVRIDYTKKKILFRSASRAGHSDLGVNRKRVESIKTLILKKLNSMPQAEKHERK